MDNFALEEVAELLEQENQALEHLTMMQLENTAKDFEPYPFQLKFIEAGKEYRARNLMAANQIGKTRGTAYEVYCHLTGDYPDNWTGFKFDRPITAWGLGVSNEQLHDVMQRHLFGNLQKGSDVFHPDQTVPPFIRNDQIERIERNNQIPGLVKNVYVKHLSLIHI